MFGQRAARSGEAMPRTDRAEVGRSGDLFQEGTVDCKPGATGQDRKQDGDASGMVGGLLNDGLEALKRARRDPDGVPHLKPGLDGNDIHVIARPGPQLGDNRFINDGWLTAEADHVDHVGGIANRTKMLRGIQAAEKIPGEKRLHDLATNSADYFGSAQLREVGFQAQPVIAVPNDWVFLGRTSVDAKPVHVIETRG